MSFDSLNLTQYLADIPVLIVVLVGYLWLRKRGVFSWPD
jgi:NADH:ubiquinone oxidoreductase subunit 3 (subunit A)